jgi:hypothetical protein
MLEKGLVMKRHLDALFAVLGLVLGVALMAATVATGQYAQAAGAEARGIDALFRAVERTHYNAPQAPASLLAMNEVIR